MVVIVSICEKRTLYKFLGDTLKILVWSLLAVFTVACDFREEIDILAEEYVENVFYLNELSEGELDSYFGSLDFEPDSTISIEELEFLAEKLEGQVASISDTVENDRVNKHKNDHKNI